MKFFWTLILTILWSLCGATNARADGAKITQIKLQHTQCYGPCPIDETTLNADGSAQFVGDGNSARVGFYRGQIAPDKFAQLARALEEQNFFELRPQIGDILTVDAPDAIISAIRTDSFPHNAPHSVVFRARGNRELLDKLDAAFTAATAQINWSKDEVASSSGVRGTLMRPFTRYETRLFAGRDFEQLRMRYALVELTSMDNTRTVYTTHSDGEGNFQILAPPGRYLLSTDNGNAASSMENYAYLPQWASTRPLNVEVQEKQIAPVEIQVRDYNRDTQLVTATK